MQLQEDYVPREAAADALPLRWCAPEVIVEHRHSAASDVWSLGVLFWEIFSNARTPYGALGVAEICRELQSGFRLPKPAFCTEGTQQAR